jgi:hypothetical protein
MWGQPILCDSGCDGSHGGDMPLHSAIVTFTSNSLVVGCGEADWFKLCQYLGQTLEAGFNLKKDFVESGKGIQTAQIQIR